jgi:hypothetical protein
LSLLQRITFVIFVTRSGTLRSNKLVRNKGKSNRTPNSLKLMLAAPVPGKTSFRDPRPLPPPDPSILGPRLITIREKSSFESIKVREGPTLGALA